MERERRATERGGKRSGGERRRRSERAAVRPGAGAPPAGLPPALREALGSAGAGEPLPGAVRERLDAGLGADLSAVRMQRGPAAARASRELGARAFTVGADIYLGEGEQPTDLELLAHEAAHTIQQRGEPAVQPFTDAGTADPLEREAERAAAAVRRGEPARVSRRATGFVAQRGFWSRLASAIADVAASVRDAFLAKVSSWAKRMPGYDLLCFTLGRDPIEDRPVERSAANLIRAVVGLIPGGPALWADLQRAEAVERAGEFFRLEIAKLDLSWDSIRALFSRAWDALGASDLLNPSAGWEKLRRIFAPPLQRLANFALRSARKIGELIFEGALALAGGAGQRILAILREGRAVFSLIVSDPIGFVGNLVGAVKGGFKRFRTKIRAHLRTGLVDWLTGALRGALTLPARFDFRGVLSIVLQVLGITYQRIRGALARRLGEPAVRFLEGAFELLRLLVSEGPIAAWEKIKEHASNLTDAVLAGIREWVVTKVVVAAVTKLATMINPAGALIQAVIAIYNTVMFFLERAEQIGELLKAIVGSIGKIARGAIGEAAAFVEKTLVRGLGLAISFLARLIGLGGVAKQVRKIIARIRKTVDRALDRTIDFIVERGKALLARRQKEAPPEAAPQGAAESPAIYEEREGAHKIRVLPDLRVVRESRPKPVTESKAQQARQRALEKLEGGRKEVKYPPDGDRAKGPYGHVKVKGVGEGRKSISFRGKGYLSADHRGHLIADRFCGPPTRNNLVPMHGRKLNQGTFKRFEDAVARKFRRLKEKGAGVLLWMRVIPIYPSDAKPRSSRWYRPTAILARARIAWLARGGPPAQKRQKSFDPPPMDNPKR